MAGRTDAEETADTVQQTQCRETATYSIEAVCCVGVNAHKYGRECRRERGVSEGGLNEATANQPVACASDARLLTS